MLSETNVVEGRKEVGGRNHLRGRCVIILTVLQRLHCRLQLAPPLHDADV